MKNENPRHGGNVAGAVDTFVEHKYNIASSLKFQPRINVRSASVSVRLPVFLGNFTLPEAAVLYAKHGVPVLPLHGIRNNRCTCGTFCGEAAGGHPRVPGSFERRQPTCRRYEGTGGNGPTPISELRQVRLRGWPSLLSSAISAQHH